MSKQQIGYPLELVATTKAYRYLGKRFCEQNPSDRFRLLDIKDDSFPDGHPNICVQEDVWQHRVILIGGGISAEEQERQMLLAGTLLENGARSLRWFVPVMRGSTMERAKAPGQAVTAKYIARQYSNLPVPASRLDVILIEPHIPALVSFFERPVYASVADTTELIQNLIRDDAGKKPFKMASADLGRAKEVARHARALGVDVVLVDKDRVSGKKTRANLVIGDPDGHRLYMYDDMIRTGGSIIGAAELLKEQGAGEIIAVTSHAILPGNALSKLKKSGLISRVLAFDSHPRALELEKEHPDFIQVHSLAPAMRSWVEASISGERFSDTKK